MHIAGSKNLPYTDFSVESLAKVIPSKQTRILIYCNNNIIPDSPETRRAYFGKIASVSLNTSTFPALLGYGYENVYELGPAIKVKESKIKFESSPVTQKTAPVPQQVSQQPQEPSESSTASAFVVYN